MVSQYPKLIQGDSRRLNELIPKESVDLVLTCPPYWNEVIYSEDLEQLSKVADYSSFLKELLKVWQATEQILKPGGVLAIWLHDFYREDVFGEKVYIPFHADLVHSIPEGMVMRNILVWDRYLSRNKGSYPVESALGTRLQYVLIFQKPGHGENQELIHRSLLENFWNPIWRKKTHPHLLGSQLLFRLAFEVGKHFKENLNPLKNFFNKKFIRDAYLPSSYATEDPEEVIRRLIDDYSGIGDVVLDPFMGSGTTVKVAQEMGRSGVGVDINFEAIEKAKNKLKSMLK